MKRKNNRINGVSDAGIANLQGVCMKAIRKELEKYPQHCRLHTDMLRAMPTDLAEKIITGVSLSGRGSDYRDNLTDQFGSTAAAAAARRSVPRLDIRVLNLFSGLDVDKLHLHAVFDTTGRNIDADLSNLVLWAYESIQSFQLYDLARDVSASASTLTDYGIAQLCTKYSHALVRVNVAGCRGLSEESLGLFSSLPLLSELNIEDCSLVINAWPLDTRTLRKLHIGGNVVPEDVLYRIAGAHDLVALSLHDENAYLSKGKEDGRYHILVLSFFGSVQNLDIRGVGFQHDCVLEVVAQLSSLQTFDASHSNMNDELIVGLSHLKLSALALNSTDISFRSMEMLSVNSAFHSLQYLSLAATNLLFPQYSSGNMGREFPWTFVNMVHLKQLDLRFTALRLNSTHGEYFQRAEGFKLFPKSLRFLDISHSQLLDENLQSSDAVLADSISSLCYLEALHTINMRFSSQHWIEAIGRNKPELTSLDISGTNMKEDVFRAVVAPLKQLRFLGMEQFYDIHRYLDDVKGKMFPRLENISFSPSSTSQEAQLLELNELLAIVSNNDAVQQPLSSSAFAKTTATADGIVDTCPALAVDGGCRLSREDMLKLRDLPVTRFLSPNTNTNQQAARLFLHHRDISQHKLIAISGRAVSAVSI